MNVGPRVRVPRCPIDAFGMKVRERPVDEVEVQVVQSQVS